MAGLKWLSQALARQRGQLLCWAPIFLGIGIAMYMASRSEPASHSYALALGIVSGILVLSMWLTEDLRPLIAAIALIVLGACLAGVRAHAVGEPVLSYRYYGPIQGRIVHIDRSASDAQRLTLDRVVLADMGPSRTPSRVRVSLHGQQGYITAEPGLTVILTGHLLAPSGPVEPGGFDFQRQSWFQGLGAVGYTRTPVLALRAPELGGVRLRIYRARLAISKWVQAELPGEAGAFAAAVTTGDRSALSRDALKDLRASNLAHLLAISGLHMGLLTGLVFSGARILLALVPVIALRVSGKKIAAVFALLSGAVYLALSGGNVATERAFIMVSVMFVAILFGRRAITLRAVAIAALIVLLMRPEVLVQPGFQMSFAATTALVAVFGAFRGRRWPDRIRYLRGPAMVVASSAIAGLATAPVAAAHFNRIADYGLIANLLSVPLMGIAVMPGAILTAVLTPFGLGWVGLALMRPAIEWVLGVANWVAGLDGALTYVPSPPGAALPLMALGFAWLVLWRGRKMTRGAGLVPVALAFALWGGVARPSLLVSDTGGLVGLLTDKGRVLNKPRGDGFSATVWLENDGDAAIQEAAFERSGFSGVKGDLTFQLGATKFAHLSGRGAASRFDQACRVSDVVFITVAVEGATGPCVVFDPTRMKDTGSLAISEGAGIAKITTARDLGGTRLWNSAAVRTDRVAPWDWREWFEK